MKANRKKKPDYPFMIVRLWPDHHKSKLLFDDLLRMLRKRRPACDEVWFCTECGFPSLDVHRRSAELMASAAERIREAGFGAGIQIANTLGHGDVLAWSNDGIAWRRMVGHDGTTAQYCGCPRDPALLDYVRRMTLDYAAWKPDSVWIDDDLRMNNHHPVTNGCFCDFCISEFSREAGWKRRDRQTLVKAIGGGNDTKLRLKWIEFGRRSVARLAGTIASTVHSLAPKCRMALQHAGHEFGVYNGPDHKPIFDAMAKTTGLKVGSRPGAGFYTDHAPREMILKAYDIGRQVARMPDCVGQICAEVENFTHIAMGKSPYGTAVESTMHMALGCNSLSYAVLCANHESMEWYGELLKELAAWRPFWEEFAGNNAGTVVGGIHVEFSPQHARRKVKADEKDFAWANISFNDMYRLSAIGLPLTADPRRSCGSLLTGRAIAGMSDGEIGNLLKGGVLADGVAAMRLQERGFGKVIGMKVEARPNQSFEYFTDDPLNGKHAGHVWQIIFKGGMSAYALTPLSGKARVLGEYRTVSGEPAGAATMIAETTMGGRIAVFGYDGFESVVSSARRHQIIAAADWVSHGRLPVLIRTSAQIVAIPRVDRNGRTRGVVLLNPSIGRSQAILMDVRRPAGRLTEMITPGGRSLLKSVVMGGGQLSLRIPSMKPWSVAWIKVTG
ncbi:MAG: hypothetical protein C0404_10095 [Verrucomicrobia bacterium]|nr:hypothetical protein [Verrucomicrobiota bacterium]